MQRRINVPLFDTIWLVLLCLYALAGMMLVPFHPDETEHVRMSQDYAFIFLDHNLERVENVVDPATHRVLPGDPTVRLVEAPLHAYVTGAIWHLAGMTRADLPPPWNWSQDFAANVAAGHRPSVAMLAAGRLAATLFLCLSILAIYGIGLLFGGRPAALLVSGLYALNPVILMHARRAMLEGPLLCLGLVTLLIAGVISTRKPGQRIPWWWWLALALAGGVGMAAKYTYIFFFAAALGWIVCSRLLAWIMRRHLTEWRDLAKLVVQMAAVGIIALAVFIGLSPALWSDPYTRILDSANLVQSILDSQVRSNLTTPLTLEQRFQNAVETPFLRPIEYGHVPEETQRYAASAFHGIDFPGALGQALTGVAVFGLIAVFIPRLGLPPRLNAGALRIGLVVWLGVFALLASKIPLPWQRYYVGFVPLGALLAGIGLLSAARILAEAAQRIALIGHSQRRLRDKPSTS